MLVHFGLGVTLLVRVTSCFLAGPCSCLSLTSSKSDTCLSTFLSFDLTCLNSEGMRMLRYALLNIAILSTYRVSRRCSCTPCILHTTIQSQSFTLKDALPFVSRRCSSLRVICLTRPIAGCTTSLLKELCISKRCSALSVQLVWSLAMGRFCMHRSIEILWYSARWEAHGDQVSLSRRLPYIDLTDQLLDTKSDSSGAGYIRNPGLLSRSPEKSRTRSTKPILDVTDSGAVSSFVLEL